MAFGQPQVDFGYFLARKYAQLQQQADATTANAAATTLNANTNATVGAAAAKLDTTRAGLMPAESASTIGLQGAQRSLLGEQAKYFGPTALSQIRNTDASTGFIGTQDKVLKREGLEPRFGGALGGVMGGSTPGMYSLTGPTPAKQPGETEYNYMNRINGF